jgi:hypothetical protein
MYMGFEKLTKSLAGKGIKDPKALAASIGRKKYGKEAFQKMSLEGRGLGRRAKTVEAKGLKSKEKM